MRRRTCHVDIVETMQIAGNPSRPKSVAFSQIQDLGNGRTGRSARTMQRRSGPIAQASLPVALVPSAPFVEGFARKTEIPAGLSYASGQVVGLPQELQPPGNHSVLFVLFMGSLMLREGSQNVTLVLGLHTAPCFVRKRNPAAVERLGPCLLEVLLIPQAHPA
jgi:hypothetical protein